MVLSGLVKTGVQLAAARFLLGAGESTGLPSSTSMIADMFRTRFRAIAFSVLAASPFIGLLLGFPIVGWVAQHHGWRMAFVAAGAPGILIGLLFFLTVKEPMRRTSGGGTKVDSPANFRESAVFLLRSPAYVFILIAGSLGAVNFGSMLAWGPTFLARIHELSPQAAGGVFGGARGIAGLVGAMSAGVIVNALARNNENWRVWAPAIAATLLFPVDAIFLYAPGILVAQCALAIDAFLSAALVAATYTLYIGVAKARMRAVASALYFLVANLTGLTFGPFIVGYFNDQMSAQLGAAAIRYSMLFAASFAMWAGVALFITSRYWLRDVSRAYDH